jgi:hypothetical protein
MQITTATIAMTHMMARAPTSPMPAMPRVIGCGESVAKIRHIVRFDKPGVSQVFRRAFARVTDRPVTLLQGVQGEIATDTAQPDHAKLPCGAGHGPLLYRGRRIRSPA